MHREEAFIGADLVWLDTDHPFQFAGYIESSADPADIALLHRLLRQLLIL